MSSKTVLLVENEAIIAFYERMWLIKQGFNVVHAASGKEAVHIVLNNSSRIDIILMDIDLGNGIDGIEAARKILESHDVPIIFLSSHSEKDIIEKAEKVSPYGYVIKGSDNEILLTSIKMAFKLHKANKALRRIESESEARYRMVFENSVDGIILISSDNKVIEANPAACAITGMTEQEILARGRYGLVDMADSRLAPAIEERARTGKFIGPLTYIKKDGTKFPVEITSATFKDENQKEMIYIFFRDITEQKQYEDSLQRYTMELETSNSIKDKSLSVIAHDLRGPFYGFLRITKELAENIHDMSISEISEIASLIYKTAEKANELITNLFEWSRLQMDKVDFNPQKQELFFKTEDIINLFCSSAADKSISISNCINNSHFVLADPIMLSTILRNLLDNAIKFSHKGGHIMIGSAATDSHIEISVSDSGDGIPEDVIDKVFLIDSAKTTTGTNGEKGCGFGLPLCSELVRKNGGKIKAQNRPEGGALISFTLPVC
ncbi:MAG: PAS domain S-box protein [Bacteroidota bacterium]|nr:PAS domain S-box protein [Bacteroidota bacterium]